MLNIFSRSISRLKKKLLLYFILIAVVSLSVSAEIVLELGSPLFMKSVRTNLISELGKALSQEQAVIVAEKIDYGHVLSAVGTLQVRALLLLMVISASIIGAFFQYTQDIVTPMESMVEATKKIADGDLSVSVPVMSQDEIGQIGNLINDMSVNLQELILQIKQDINRLREKIGAANDKVTAILDDKNISEVISTKRMKVRDLKEMLDISGDVQKLMNEMIVDLSALQSYVNMYKVFQLSVSVPEIEQNDG